jgi:hypothetical protein
MRGLSSLKISLIGGLINQHAMKRLTYIFFVLSQFIINAQFISAQTEKVPVSLYERMIIDTDREVYIAGEKVHFKLSLFQDQSFKYSGLSKYAYVILVNESGRNLLSFQVSLSDGIYYSDFLLPDTLITGGYRLIAFTNWMRNFNPENYGLRNLIVVNRFDNNFDRHGKINAADTTSYYTWPENNHIILSSLKEEYRCGDSILFSIRLPDSEIDNAEISVSVAENAPIKNINPDRYLEKPINGDTLLSEFSFFPEIYQPVIQGNVLKNNYPVSGASIILTSPDSILNFQYTKTNEQGVFRFQLGNYYDGRKLVFKLANQADSDLLIQYDNKFNVVNKGIIYPFNYQLPDYFIHSQKIVTIQKTYFNFKQLINAEYKRESPPVLYVKPGSIVYPSDFFELKDLIEISREILPSLRIYKKDKEFKIEMFNTDDQVFFKTPPLILYNGVPVDQLNQILHLGSTDISHIEIIDALWAYGDLEFPGVLGIFTPDYSLAKLTIGENTLVVDNPGPLPSVRFDELLPESSGNSDHFPDFRQLLYWNPDVKVFHEKPVLIKIKAPRNEGVFKIVINGITGNNQPLSSCHTFLVKR